MQVLAEVRPLEIAAKDAETQLEGRKPHARSHDAKSADNRALRRKPEGDGFGLTGGCVDLAVFQGIAGHKVHRPGKVAGALLLIRDQPGDHRVVVESAGKYVRSRIDGGWIEGNDAAIRCH